MSGQQKALVIPAPSSPYTIVSKSIPVPGANEVLVNLQAVALNPLENLLAQPRISSELRFPLYTGSDGAGVVEEIGKDVTTLKKGDRVQGFQSDDYTTYQQYALAPANLVAKLPSTISLLEGASLPMALVTSAFGFCLPDPAVQSFTEMASHLAKNPLFTTGRAGAGIKPFWEEGASGLKSGQPIVILGGSSSVGQLAIQIASHYGFSPIITTSSTKHTEHLEYLGVTHVIDRDASIDVVKSILQGSTLDYIFAAVNGAISQAHVDLLAPGGTLIAAIRVPPSIHFKDGKKSVLTSGGVHIYKEFGAGLMGTLEGLLERGVIKPNRIEKIPRGLAGIADGLSRLQNNQVSGAKLVVDPTETPELCGS